MAKKAPAKAKAKAIKKPATKKKDQGATPAAPTDNTARIAELEKELTELKAAQPPAPAQKPGEATFGFPRK